jgi:hypothetical protein
MLSLINFDFDKKRFLSKVLFIIINSVGARTIFINWFFFGSLFLMEDIFNLF